MNSIQLTTKKISMNTIILIGILILAASVRFYGLDKQSLWYDEITEETGFQRQFLNVGGMTPYSPPLHLFFIYPVTKLFPNNDFALRIVPFTFGLLTIPFMYLLVRKIFHERVALIASFLLAISPFHIWYSQEVRMYALQWLIALISFIFFLRTLEKPTLGNYAGYTLSTTAGLYTLQLSVFVMVIHVLYLLIFARKYKTQLVKWVCAFGLIVVLYFPYIIYTLKTFERMYIISREFSLLLSLPYTFFSYFAGFSLGPSLRELHFNPSISVLQPYFLIVALLIIVYITLTALGLFSIINVRQSMFLLLLFVTVPIIGVAILSEISQSIRYNVRYTGIAMFGFLIIIAKGIDWMSHLKSQKMAIILSMMTILVITGFSVYSYANYQFNNKYQKADIRKAVTYIRDNKLPGDSVLCIDSFKAFNRYASRFNFECNKLSADDRTDRIQLDRKISNILNDSKRLWLVISDEWYVSKLLYYIGTKHLNKYQQITRLSKGPRDIANVQIYCFALSKSTAFQLHQNNDASISIY